MLILFLFYFSSLFCFNFWHQTKKTFFRGHVFIPFSGNVVSFLLSPTIFLHKTRKQITDCSAYTFLVCTYCISASCRLLPQHTYYSEPWQLSQGSEISHVCKWSSNIHRLCITLYVQQPHIIPHQAAQCKTLIINLKKQSDWVDVFLYLGLRVNNSSRPLSKHVRDMDKGKHALHMSFIQCVFFCECVCSVQCDDTAKKCLRLKKYTARFCNNKVQLLFVMFQFIHQHVH